MNFKNSIDVEMRDDVEEEIEKSLLKKLKEIEEKILSCNKLKEAYLKKDKNDQTTEDKIVSLFKDLKKLYEEKNID